MVTIYLISLFLSPQLWVEPLIGLRLDLIVYPAWFIFLFISGRGPNIFRFKVQDKLFIAFLVWLYLSIAINEKNIFTIDYSINYIKWFFLYRLVSVSLDTSEAFRSTINKLVFIVLIIAVEAIQHKYSADGIGWAGQTLAWVDQSVLDAGGTGRTRWINIFDGPGVFCVMFTLVLPFLLVKLDSHNSFSSKFIHTVLVLLLLLAIWTTGSRGGFLATLVIFAAYGLSRMNISISRMIVVGSVIGIIFMLAPSYMTNIKDENKSAQHRVKMWIEGVEMVQQNPVLGIGRGNFASYTGSLIAHNSAIEIMGELGFPGIFFWFAFIYISIKTIMQALARETNNEYRSYYKGLILCIIGYLANSMFVTLEYETFYFILALSRSLNNKKDDDIVFNYTDARRVVLIVIGFYIFLKIFVRIY